MLQESTTMYVKLLVGTSFLVKKTWQKTEIKCTKSDKLQKQAVHCLLLSGQLNGVKQRSQRTEQNKTADFSIDP